jgi:hypothetical protein
MLKKISASWDVIHAEETRLLRAISPQEGMRQFFALMAEFGPRLRETESMFRGDRDQAMIQLQARLASLNVKKSHERSN